MTKRLMLLEENRISFHSDDGVIVDGVKDYCHKIAEMIGLGSDTEFHEAGVHNVLDIGCGFGSLDAHLLFLKLMPVCIAAYESSGSQVQLALERGLPAIISSFISRQLPFIVWYLDAAFSSLDGMFLIEVDRVLKPGGYFVLTSPTSRHQGSAVGAKKGSYITPFEEFTQKLCWNLLAEQEETFIWKKTADSRC